MRLITSLLCGVVSVFFFSSSAFALKTWQGKQRAVIILLEWGNNPAVVTKATVEETFFADNKLSLKQFFQENSVGTFEMTGKVLDWRHTEETFNPNDGCDLNNIVRIAWDIFREGINIGDFDTDRNNKIDNLFIIHSGRIASDRVGPECTFTEFDEADHTIVFQSQGLGSVGMLIPIGFYIHEGGHGYYDLPDLYSDHYHGQYGVGMWGMMGLGAWGVRNDIKREDLFRYPSHFEPLSKIKIGWLKPRIVNTTQKNVALRPVEKTGDIVSVPIKSGTNLYLEYRSPVGFSTEHKGHGLLIWKNYDLIQADGRDDLNNGNNLGYRPLPPISENFGDASDPFPGSLQIKSYTASGVRIENIVQTAEQITFDVIYSSGDEKEPIPYLDPIVPTYSGQEKL